MTSIQPSLPNVTTPAAAPQGVTTAVVVQASPQVLQGLQAALQSILTATAQAGPSRGMLQLQTPAGPATVKLPMTVPDGAEVQVQVLTAGATPLLRVLTVNGQPVAPNGQIATPPAAATAPPPSPVATAAPAAEATPTPQGLTATVMVPAKSGPSLPAGTTLLVRIVSQAPPAPAPAAPPPSAAAAPPPPNPAAPPAAAPSPAASAAPTPQDPADPSDDDTPTPPDDGDASSLATTARLARQAYGGAVTDPTEPDTTADDPADAAMAAAPPPGAPPALLTGTVAANSHGGRQLVQTSLGLLALETPADLPAGTVLSLETIGRPHAPSVQGGNAASGKADSPWPGLDVVLGSLRQDPTLLAALLQRLPALGPQLAMNLMMMASAVRSGRSNTLLGEKLVAALQKAGRGDVVKHLDEALEGMHTPVRIAGNENSDWQTLLLPMMFGETLDKVRLMIRRPPDEEAAGGRDEVGTRFLVDVDLSQLGPLQLDGLIKRGAKRFDLILRTHRPLSEETRRDIQAIFARSLEGLGLTGGASFLPGGRFIQAIPAAPPASAGLLI